MRVGTHTSIAKGPELAFERSSIIGGTTMQVFAKSPRGRKIPTYTDEQYEQGMKNRKEFGQLGGMVHSNYLANLSKSEDELGVEIESIVQDFEFAHRLGFDSVNVHVGKLKGRENRDEAMRNMVINVEKILTIVRNNGRGDIQYVFENTAGQGSEIGSTFEELSYFYTNYLKDLPVKFTIDTAHCQGGGIDVAQRDQFIEQFDASMGIEQLYAIHLNDSKAILGSHLDRHASLGRGFIGFPALSKVIRWAAKNERGLYIETPEPDRWSDEIAKVRSIISGDDSWVEQFHNEFYKTQFLKKFASEATGKETLF